MGLEYADGLLFLAENPSATLHKISEVYDKIAFAGVGKYSEFEELRIAGIRLADLRGYQYGREDVKARDLANAYSQALSTIFTQQMKPYEIELLVGEVDGDANGTSIYHILFDGPSRTRISTWRWVATPRSSPTRSRTVTRQAGTSRPPCGPLCSCSRPCPRLATPRRTARGRGAGPLEHATADVPPAPDLRADLVPRLIAARPPAPGVPAGGPYA